jgi:small-conductance mechanosensitive channel
MSLKDILADVMAGIMLITGRTFEVGDYIEIRDACAGTVKSMGLRKTELISDSGRSFFIRNSHINKVTNHSRLAEKKKEPDGKKEESDGK